MFQARSLPLRGRPDLLIRQGNAIIPVEVKTGRTPREPYRGHVLQLLAYCLLVEERHGVRPPYGLIRYPEREFRIDYDEWRERELRALVEQIAGEKRLARERHRDHRLPPRCTGCGFRARCDERLSG